MKRLTLLAVALVMILGMAVSASAAPEVSISGNVLVNAVWRSNWDFADGNGSLNQSDTQAMRIQERADLYFTVTANENLKGVIGFPFRSRHLGSERSVQRLRWWWRHSERHCLSPRCLHRLQLARHFR